MAIQPNQPGDIVKRGLHFTTKSGKPRVHLRNGSNLLPPQPSIRTPEASNGRHTARGGMLCLNGFADHIHLALPTKSSEVLDNNVRELSLWIKFRRYSGTSTVGARRASLTGYCHPRAAGTMPAQ